MTTTIRCFWCPTTATGTVIERDHTGFVCDATPACDDHGERWHGTSIHERHACSFHHQFVFRNFRDWIHQWMDQRGFDPICENSDWDRFAAIGTQPA